MTDLGFDEGGVLQALATPIVSSSTTKTSKNGRTSTTTKFELTGAHVIALLLGNAFLRLFLRYKDMTDEEKCYAKWLLAAGPLTGPSLYKVFGCAEGAPIEKMEKKAALVRYRALIASGLTHEQAIAVIKEEFA